MCRIQAAAAEPDFQLHARSINRPSSRETHLSTSYNFGAQTRGERRQAFTPAIEVFELRGQGFDKSDTCTTHSGPGRWPRPIATSGNQSLSSIEGDSVSRSCPRSRPSSPRLQLKRWVLGGLPSGQLTATHDTVRRVNVFDRHLVVRDRID
jgi:hypothetical protein